MTDVKRKYELLRDENERLAKEADKRMLDPSLSRNEQIEAMEQAKVYWQLSRVCSDTVSNASEAERAKFGPKAGPRQTTQDRSVFLKALSDEIGTTNHKEIARTALSRKQARHLWREPGKRLSDDKLISLIKSHLKNHKPLK